MQYTDTKIDSRAHYEAPQSDLINVVGGGRILLNTSPTTPEGWDVDDYDW